MITTVQSAVKIAIQQHEQAIQKKQEEQAAFTPYWKFPIFDDDDDEYTIQYKKYLENSSNAITLDLATEEPDNSLSMEDEHLDTIPETESDEDIDYVEASPPDSELVSLEEVNDDILHEKLLNINLLIACDLPLSDDFSPISIFEEKFVTFSNPIFDSNDDFSSSDNESLSDEDIPKDVKIYSNPLFESIYT
ncbi:hypothetical protein Tco_0112381 [Tanacetum coccineum]